jgi:hypothetical protein
MLEQLNTLNALNAIIKDENASLSTFQAALQEEQRKGFNPNYVYKAGFNYNSLLKACIENPSDHSFTIFEYLINNKLVNIEDQLSALTIDWDPQKAPPDLNKTKKFLDFIYENTNSEQRNKCQLFNLSIFFNHQELFKKLLDDPAIQINSPGQRDSTPLTDVFMTSNRQEITRMFIESDRFTEGETGHLRDDALMQLFLFSPMELVELALKDPKLPKYSNFNEAIYSSITNSVRGDRDRAYIALYNSVEIDVMKVMSTQNFATIVLPSLALAHEWYGSACNRLLFFTDPRVIDIIHTSYLEITNPDATARETPKLPKLAYILQCVRDLDGLDFAKIAKKEHLDILNQLNSLDARTIDRLAISLDIKGEDIKGEDNIKKFCDSLAELVVKFPEFNMEALLGINKLEASMKALERERNMNPIVYFFTMLFTDPAKLFNPLKPLEPIQPNAYFSEGNFKDNEEKFAREIQGEFGKLVQQKAKEAESTVKKLEKTKEQELRKFEEVEKPEQNLKRAKKYTDSHKPKMPEEQKKNWENTVSNEEKGVSKGR